MNSANSDSDNKALLIREIIPLSQDCSFAVLTLNRPKAMNALNLGLARELLSALNEIKEQAGVVAVLLKGAGDRAFCAGGDIKEMYASVIDKKNTPFLQAEAFFEIEYTLDYTIHSFHKPIVVWGHGVVMGGGLGLFQGGTFRVVETNARLAMPEVTIGLYPDVAASYSYNQFAEPWGRYFALTGAVMNSTEAVALGLADFQVDQDTLDAFFDGFSEYTWKRDDEHVRKNINQILNDIETKSQLGRPLSRLDAIEGVVKDVFLDTSLEQVEKKVKSLSRQTDLNVWLKDSFQTMLNGSALSLCCSDQALRENKGRSLVDVFKFDMMYVTHMIRNPEFAEGVRALLIDKDKKPKWQYNTVSAVPKDLLLSMLKAPWKKHPLEGLDN